LLLNKINFTANMNLLRYSRNEFLDETGNKINKSKPIKIGNHVWVGKGCAILKGVTIGDGAIVGAHSVVTKDIPPRTLVAGVPAKIIKENVNWKR